MKLTNQLRPSETPVLCQYIDTQTPATQKKKRKTNRICKTDGCCTIATFNNPGASGAISCSKHRTDVMTDNINKKCIEDGCNTNRMENPITCIRTTNLFLDE